VLQGQDDVTLWELE